MAKVGRPRTVHTIIRELLELDERLGELNERIRAEERRKLSKALTVQKCLAACKVKPERLADLRDALQPLAFPGDPRFSTVLGRYYHQVLRDLREGRMRLPIDAQSFDRFFTRADYEACVPDFMRYELRLPEVLAVAVDIIANDPACDALFGDVDDLDAWRKGLDDFKKQRGELLARRALVREEAEAMKADVEAALR